MTRRFDVVVIGAGPGGYIAAIRAAQLGFSTACIDDWSRPDGRPAPGGTCTNVGCIPSKALLQSSENYAHAAHAFANHGIGIQGLSVDVAKMLGRKDKVVEQNNDGILYLFKKNKVSFVHGRASFAGGGEGGWQIQVAPAMAAASAVPAMAAEGAAPAMAAEGATPAMAAEAAASATSTPGGRGRAGGAKGAGKAQTRGGAGAGAKGGAKDGKGAPDEDAAVDPGGSAAGAGDPGPEVLVARHVIIATGSNARPLPGVAFDNDRILDNGGALAIPTVPKTLGVIGAGVIGLEMGSVWRRLGAEVTLLEALPTFLGVADDTIAREAQKLFVKQGLAMHFGATVGKVASGKDGVGVEWTDANGGPRSAVFERLIVSIGRIPNTEGLNAGAVGLAVDERGFVVVDEHCRTNLPDVWAIGDVVRGPMLAHKAEEEGVAVAERIAGQHPHVDFNTVPWVIYTSPEIAWVGQTEQQLKAAGVAYTAGSFPFMANGRARALGDTSGLVKILADARTDRILGVHVVGPMASELIAEGVVAMEFGASAEDIARVCHAHPSLSEATKEAALAVGKRSLNF